MASVTISTSICMLPSPWSSNNHKVSLSWSGSQILLETSERLSLGTTVYLAILTVVTVPSYPVSFAVKRLCLNTYLRAGVMDGAATSMLCRRTRSAARSLRHVPGPVIHTQCVAMIRYRRYRSQMPSTHPTGRTVDLTINRSSYIVVGRRISTQMGSHPDRNHRMHR